MQSKEGRLLDEGESTSKNKDNKILKRKCLPRDIAPVAELLVLFCVPGGPATLSFTRESDVEGRRGLTN